MAKILIVDDDQQVTALFEKFLSTKGHHVISVNDSTKAVEAALKVKPDLFILDLMMPEPDGFKVCRLLRKFPEFVDTPILIVTASNADDSKVIAFGAGADDYLTKPFMISELGDRVRKLIGKKK